MTDYDNICDYLNITTTTKSDSNNLTGKFAVLDSSKSLTIFEWLFSSMIHQLIVAKCSYYFKLADVATPFYYDHVLVYYDKSKCITPVFAWIMIPGLFVPLSFFFNLSLLLVTFTTMFDILFCLWAMLDRIRDVFEKDHKVCNWLIAYDSLCQLFVVAPFGVNLIGAIFYYDSIDYRFCLGTLMASTVASYASIMAIYLVSIERLLIIMYPIKMNWNKKSAVHRCSIVSAIFCTLFGIVMNMNVFNVWTIINLPYERWVYCNSGLYSDVLNTVPSYAILLLCTLNYAAIFGMILWRHKTTTAKTQSLDASVSKTSAADKSMRKMLRSVFLLLMVVLIGWLISSAARNQMTNFVKNISSLIANWFADPTTHPCVNSDILSLLIAFITFVPILASASSAPILLLNSYDYRIAYKRAFKRSINSSAVGPFFST